MFEQAIFEYIKNNFALTGNICSFGFGEVNESVQSPYIIQYSLNASGDAQFLCEENNFESGEAFIQWTIYDNSFSNAFFLKHELMKFIGQLKTITLNSTTYLVQLNKAESSPSGVSLDNGLAAEVVTRSFTYKKEV